VTTVRHIHGRSATAAAKARGGKYDIADNNQTNNPTGYGPMIERNLFIICKG
jgi:hypothetical protein